MNKHEFYSSRLEIIYDILDAVSDNCFSIMNNIRYEENMILLRGEAFVAAMNTICTIDFCCNKGFLSDAFTLTRKYRDDILQYIFASYALANYDNYQFYEDKISLKEKTSVEFPDWIKAVSYWYYSKIDFKTLDKVNEDERKEINRIKRLYFGGKEYINNLKKDKLINELFDQYIGGLWISVNSLLNDYVHTNGFKYLKDNINYYSGNKVSFEKILDSIEQITSIWIAILSLTQPQYFMASDYCDYLDVGLVPPEGCQYNVIGNVVDFMNLCFPKINSNLLEFIEQNNPYTMKFRLSDY